MTVKEFCRLKGSVFLIGARVLDSDRGAVGTVYVGREGYFKVRWDDGRQSTPCGCNAEWLEVLDGPTVVVRN
jgi:hypothetical protein